MKVMKMFNEGMDDLFVPDEKNPNAQGPPHYDKPNGFDESIKELWNVYISQHQQIQDKLGVNDIRSAESTSANEGYKLKMETLQASRNATYYIDDMLMTGLASYAKNIVGICQDMIALKDSDGYSAIEKAVGIKNIKSLQVLNRIPMHKYGIMVDTFNNDVLRMRMLQKADEALQNKEIPYHVYVLIMQIKNVKRASQILAYEKKKQEQLEQKKAEQQQKYQMEQISAKTEADKAMELMKRETILLKAGKENEGIIEVAKIQTGASVQIKQMNHDAENPKNQSRADAKIREKKAEADIKAGEQVVSESDL